MARAFGVCAARLCSLIRLLTVACAVSVSTFRGASRVAAITSLARATLSMLLACRARKKRLSSDSVIVLEACALERCRSSIVLCSTEHATSMFAIISAVEMLLAPTGATVRWLDCSHAVHTTSRALSTSLRQPITVRSHGTDRILLVISMAPPILATASRTTSASCSGVLSDLVPRPVARLARCAAAVLETVLTNLVMRSSNWSAARYRNPSDAARSAMNLQLGKADRSTSLVSSASSSPNSRTSFSVRSTSCRALMAASYRSESSSRCGVQIGAPR